MVKSKPRRLLQSPSLLRLSAQSFERGVFGSVCLTNIGQSLQCLSWLSDAFAHTGPMFNGALFGLAALRRGGRRIWS